MQIDDTQTWSVVQLNKVVCKISAEYVKACKKKSAENCIFDHFKFQKGHYS